MVTVIFDDDSFVRIHEVTESNEGAIAIHNPIVHDRFAKAGPHERETQQRLHR